MQLLEEPAEPAGLADQLDRGDRLAARLALPLPRHFRAARHAGLWREDPGAQSRSAHAQTARKLRLVLQQPVYGVPGTIKGENEERSLLGWPWMVYFLSVQRLDPAVRSDVYS